MKNVLITGVSGGIGSALAKGYADAGYHVIGMGRKDPESPYVHKNYAVDLDRLVTDVECLNAWTEAFFREYETLDVLVNNSAVQILADTDHYELKDWQKTMNVNLTAPFLLSKTLLPLLERANGCILNIGSIHARQTKPRFVAYATSKAGLVGLTQAMAVDLGPRVRVNCVSPAAVETEMLKDGFKHDLAGYQQLEQYHPIGRVGRPEEIASLCLYLSSNECGFLTGANIEVDGAISKRLHDPN